MMKRVAAKKTARNFWQPKAFPKTTFKNPAKPLIFSRRIGSFFDQPDFRDPAATPRDATARSLIPA
jgi:hypothetical protein